MTPNLTPLAIENVSGIEFPIAGAPLDNIHERSSNEEAQRKIRYGAH